MELHVCVAGEGWAGRRPGWSLTGCPSQPSPMDPRLHGAQRKAVQPGLLLPPLRESLLPDVAFGSLLTPFSNRGLTLSILGAFTPVHVVTEGAFLPGSRPSAASPAESGNYLLCVRVCTLEIVTPWEGMSSQVGMYAPIGVHVCARCQGSSMSVYLCVCTYFKGGRM